jgi:hypothetical protein
MRNLPDQKLTKTDHALTTLPSGWGNVFLWDCRVIDTCIVDVATALWRTVYQSWCRSGNMHGDVGRPVTQQYSHLAVEVSKLNETTYMYLVCFTRLWWWLGAGGQSLVSLATVQEPWVGAPPAGHRRGLAESQEPLCHPHVPESRQGGPGRTAVP